MILVLVHESWGQSTLPTVAFAVVLPVSGMKLSPLIVMRIPLVVTLHLFKWYLLLLSLVKSEG